MRVRVRGYLTLAELLGDRQVELESGASLRTLLDNLAAGDARVAARVYSRSEGLRRGVAVLINGRHHTHTQTGLDTLLGDDDEVAVFPPLAGG